MNKLFKLIFLISLIIVSTQVLYAQDLFKGKDLSQIRVDQLSDADIDKLKAQLNSSGMTIDQTESMVLAKGMSAAEFIKLKQRLLFEKNKPGLGREDKDNGPRFNNSSDSLSKGNYGGNTPRPLINSLIFGSELYTSASPSFEPNLKIATPINYIVGPDDQLQVSVFGVQEYTGDLVVSPEGVISIPNIGQIKVAGMTIEAVIQKLRTILGNSVYSSLRSGNSKLSVTIGNIRSIKVTVIGSTHPSNYTLSSLATVYHALYVSGGPSEFGSFRQIELVRNNKVINIIDLYQLLLHGDQSSNVGLKDNDIIRIPAYKNRIEIQGQVKRPGIFEVLPNENFADILAFASNFTDTAYRASVKVFQRNEKERKVTDLTSSEFVKYHPQSGDVFVVSKILNRFENRVRISGAVFRPDVYALQPGFTVADLIRKADGLKEDAFMGRGQIIRLQENLTREIISFDIKKALKNEVESNPLLQREDEVLISSILELKDSFNVKIQGEIRFPGQYEFIENLTLKDLILQAGGFTDAAFKNIEIARLISRDSLVATDNRASAIINTEIYGEEGLLLSNVNIPLQPYDVITVRRKAGYTLPESILVSGQVQFPGPYVISKRNEKVSDILKRAGGYTPDSYPEGAYLKRYKTDAEKRNAQDVINKLQKNLNDTNTLKEKTLYNDIKREYDKIPLDLVSILKSPGSIEDLIVRVQDELVVPKFDGQVKISGAVLMATQVTYQQKNNLKDYINQAGGFSGDAWRKKAYVVYANGKAATTKYLLFLKFYPKLLPGSELVVPQKPERKRASTGEIIGISSALASLAGVVIAILRL